MKKILLVIVYFLIVFIAGAQKPPFKYGKVSKEELEMKVYANDTSAPAVILYDYGYFSSLTYQFTRTCRIKILKKEGLSYGNKTLRTYSQSMISGKTFNLENGEIITSKLKSENIFKERVTNDFFRYKISMPNVKVGSVIDLEYTMDFLPEEWNFQYDIPVSYSELLIEPTMYVLFKKSFSGFEPITTIDANHWLVRNMPAFKVEPYISSSENFMNKFVFDLLSIQIPGRMVVEFTTDWNAVSKRLLDDYYFGVALNSDFYMKAVAKKIKAEHPNVKDQIIAAYNYVQTIKWNQDCELFTTYKVLEEAFNKGKGNSADINLILVQLLTRLDLDAKPVVLSTRENGFVLFFSPSINQLNYVIARVKIGEEVMLLDATEKYIPAGMLPERCLNLQGVIVDKNNSAMIDLKANKKDKRVIMYDLKLDDTGSLAGKISYNRYDYSAFDFRTRFRGFNSDDEYLASMESDKYGLKIDSFKLQNIDSIYKPTQEEYYVSIKNRVEKVNDELYLYPLFFDQVKENPFKLDVRKYPVDFIYPFEKSIIIRVAIPENHTVISLPKPMNMKLPNNSGSMTYAISADNGVIQVSYKLNINKSVFIESEYKDLKEFYQQMVLKHAEPVILKKI